VCVIAGTAKGEVIVKALLLHDYAFVGLCPSHASCFFPCIDFLHTCTSPVAVEVPALFFLIRFPWCSYRRQCRGAFRCRIVAKELRISTTRALCFRQENPKFPPKKMSSLRFVVGSWPKSSKIRLAQQKPYFSAESLGALRFRKRGINPRGRLVAKKL